MWLRAFSCLAAAPRVTPLRRLAHSRAPQVLKPLAVSGFLTLPELFTVIRDGAQSESAAALAANLAAAAVTSGRADVRDAAVAAVSSCRLSLLGLLTPTSWPSKKLDTALGSVVVGCPAAFPELTHFNAVQPAVQLAVKRHDAATVEALQVNLRDCHPQIRSHPDFSRAVIVQAVFHALRDSFGDAAETTTMLEAVAAPLRAVIGFAEEGARAAGLAAADATTAVGVNVLNGLSVCLELLKDELEDTVAAGKVVFGLLRRCDVISAAAFRAWVDAPIYDGAALAQKTGAEAACGVGGYAVAAEKPGRAEAISAAADVVAA